MANGTRIKVGFFKNADQFLKFKSGEVIFQEGDAGTEMFVVRSGSVDLKIGDQVLDTVGEEETFGELALIDQRPRSATAIAATDCEIVPVDSKRWCNRLLISRC
jgi:CRP-like cAMP-binding protein